MERGTGAYIKTEVLEGTIYGKSRSCHDDVTCQTQLIPKAITKGKTSLTPKTRELSHLWRKSFVPFNPMLLPAHAFGMLTL